MKNIIHLHSPVRGGVSDYVDLFLKNDINSRKFFFEIQSNFNLKISDICVLHYSGYGYAKRGAPLWLLNKINIEKKRENLLGVFFHELHAFGPITSSAFWLSPVQRYIARRLAETSDFWITNREGSADWLCKFAGDKPHAVLPVFSNVGEIPAYMSARKNKIVVFGTATVRMATYRAAGDLLFSWARKQGLELHDIGPAISDPVLDKNFRDAGVVQHGRLEAEQVSQLLSDAMFGILAYPVDCLAKSGIFAAYCAHGICPIIISTDFKESDGLIVYENFFPFSSKLSEVLIDYKSIGKEAFNWYQPHKIDSHTKIFQQLINDSKRK